MMNLAKKLKSRINRGKPEEGIALLLTVMMISGIAIITITVAFFVMQEVRISRSSTLTEPAIVAAETAGEQGIFTIKRGTFNTACTGATYTQLDGTTSGGSSNTRIKKCITTVPATFQFSAAEPLTFFLYDPTNVNGNLCMETDAVCPAGGNGVGSQLFSSVIIRYSTGSWAVNVAIETLDGVSVQNTTLNPGITGTYAISRDILGSADERLQVTLTPTAGTSTVEVSTTGVYTGLPDYQTVDAEGCVGLASITNCNDTSELYKRRINITLPR
jgi:hypothetical protein